MTSEARERSSRFSAPPQGPRPPLDGADAPGIAEAPRLQLRPVAAADHGPGQREDRRDAATRPAATPAMRSYVRLRCRERRPSPGRSGAGAPAVESSPAPPPRHPLPRGAGGLSPPGFPEELGRGPLLQARLWWWRWRFGKPFHASRQPSQVPLAVTPSLIINPSMDSGLQGT